MRARSKGKERCPGNVPLTACQCKSHRIHARYKAKSENGKGDNSDNAWIKAVKIEIGKETSCNKMMEKSACTKACCNVLESISNQVN